MLVVCVAVAAASGNAYGDRPSPHHILVRVPAEADEIQALVDLGLDVWSVSTDGRAVEIRVSQAELTDLRSRGFEPVVMVSDLYAAPYRPVSGGSREEWAAYHDLASSNQMLADLEAVYPELSALFTMGDSVEGRPINGIRISDDAANVDHSEPAFFVVGCHHAREWISVEVPLFLAEKLLQDYGTDPEVTDLVDRGEVWIVPVLNPDGYLYTQIDRWWRKNRRDNGDGSYGIDLNRNYSYRWGGSGSSGMPGSNSYRGPAPFSEPETGAVRDLFEWRPFVGGLTYHNYGQYVMCPWGYTTARPPHWAALEGLVAESAEIINDHHANPQYDYESGRWGDLLYIGSGIFVDWVYGEYEVMSAIVELRPVGAPWFELPPDQILPTCVENYPAALYMMQAAFGPDTDPIGDFDDSGTVDRADFAFFAGCLTGPGEPVPGFPLGCPSADLDHDGHVTLSDFASLQDSFGGQ